MYVLFLCVVGKEVEDDDVERRVWLYQIYDDDE
jgi:hypothetical protein